MGAVAGVTVDADNLFDLNTWYFLALVRDAGTWKLYVNGLLQAATITTDPGTPGGGNTWLGNDAYSGHTSYLQSALLSHTLFVVDGVLSSIQLLDMVNATAGPGGAGLVLGTGDDGAPAWVEPPAPAVTVNSNTEPAAKTPKPKPITPPPPP